MKSIEIAGQAVDLLPERALYWRAARMLVIADLHLGKADCMRRAGVAIPRGTTADDLARLQRVLTTTGARELMVLGDFVHAAPSCKESGAATRLDERAWIRHFANWRAGLNGIRITMVAGNHDRDFVAPGDWDVELIHGSAWRNPFRFTHYPVGHAPEGASGDALVGEPASEPDAAARVFTLAGHVHPAVRLRARGERLRLACFVVGRACAILPAFSSLAGWGEVTPTPDERCFVIAGDAVLDAG